ncbi:MAG: ribosome recycling factor [Chloroflexota bacterium]|nr:ribosome recycling factor [Chloroflexota bacterium]
MIDEVLSDAKSRMGKSIEALQKDLSTVRTGRATPLILDNVKIDYYGTPTPLKQVATISVPEARLLIIQPWDNKTMDDITKAIQKSDLGFNPTNDGHIIRIAIPPLSEERRRELVKSVNKRAEDGKVALRNIRRDAMEMLRDLEKEKEISQDEQKRAQAKLQEITDSFIAEVDRISKDKEAELLEV